MAMPAAAVTACCSAMPTSMQPAGEALAEGQQAGGVGHGRGDGDQLGVLLALLDQRLGERRGVGAGLGLATHVVQPLDRVVLRRRVPAALLGQHVHDDRAVVLRGVAERPLEPATSWPSNGPV